jgi:hypothetical protein
LFEDLALASAHEVDVAHELALLHDVLVRLVSQQFEVRHNLIYNALEHRLSLNNMLELMDNYFCFDAWRQDGHELVQLKLRLQCVLVGYYKVSHFFL